MTLNEAASKGIQRVRKPQWSNSGDYVKIDILDGGTLGPWAHLYAPAQEVLGYKRPQNYFSFHDSTDDYEEYTGPLLEPSPLAEERR